MEKSNILLNQIQTDIQELEKDIEAGLYIGKSYDAELARITNKMKKAKQIEVNERLAEMEKLGAYQDEQGNWIV